jgi:hypothetical protein
MEAWISGFNPGSVQRSVQFDADALTRIAAEETPENDHKCQECNANKDVETVSSEKPRGEDLEENNPYYEDDTALEWTTSHDPDRPGWYLRKFFVRGEAGHRLLWRRGRLTGSLYGVGGATLPAVSVFVFDAQFRSCYSAT